MPFPTRTSIVEQKGAISFVRSLVARFLGLRRRLFTWRTCYIYEKRLDEVAEIDETKFRPKIDDCTLKIICTPQQIDQLVSQGFDVNSYRGAEELKRRVSLGAIFFCVFVGQDFGHAVWVTLTEPAKHMFDPFPFRMDYENEACFCGSRTNRKYQGAGLYTYATARMYQFLKGTGRTKIKFTIMKNLEVPQKVQAKFNPTIYAEGRYITLLGRTFWKEKPIQKLTA